MRRPIVLVAAASIVAMAILLTACGSDDNPVAEPDPQGTIRLEPSPEYAAAPWTLTGPDEFEETGTGTVSLDDLTVGDYSVVWGDVEGFVTPAGETGELVDGQTLTFTGDYVLGAGAYTIVIEMGGGAIGGGWSLSGPGGSLTSGVAGAMLTDLDPGDYTVTWIDAEGWTTPDDETQTLLGPQITFVGDYVDIFPLPFPDSEQQAVLNFVSAYENMSVDGYVETFDPDFKVYLQQATVTEYSLTRSFFDYGEDLAITRNMFSGESPDDVLPGISSIEFPTIVQLQAWEPAQNPEFTGLRVCDYAVDITCVMGTGDPEWELAVSGQIEFYVSSQPVMHEGVERTYYRVAGQIDHTMARKVTEDVAWGSLKAMFR